MKALELEGVSPMAFATFSEMLDSLPRVIEATSDPRRFHTAVADLGLARFEDRHTRSTVEPAP